MIEVSDITTHSEVTSMAKSEKVKIEISVQVPQGTSKTKIEKTISSLLKSSSPEGFKIGAPKVVVPALVSTAQVTVEPNPSAV